MREHLCVCVCVSHYINFFGDFVICIYFCLLSVNGKCVCERVSVCAFRMINPWNTHIAHAHTPEYHIWVRDRLCISISIHQIFRFRIDFDVCFFGGSIMISQLMDHEKLFKSFSLKFALKLDACSQRECHTLGIVYIKLHHFFCTQYFGREKINFFG